MYNPIEFNPIEPNGFTMSIMQSAEDADNIIETFEEALRSGFGAEEALIYAVKANKVNREDLLPQDIARINKRVNAISESFFNTERE